MTVWEDLLKRPVRLTDESVADWFARIADELLNRTHWMVGGRPHRMTEVEFYYVGAGHHDPFAHADPIQQYAGRWYFHKTAGMYRGGSFKGVDLTFGNEDARAGILIRGLEAPDGKRIDGPSLLVDRLLAECGKPTVAALDQEINSRLAWDVTNPLHVKSAPDLHKATLSCARVGLSLRKARPGSTAPAFLTRPYRFLTDPAMIAKGKVQMVLELHRRGVPVDEIRQLTGCPTRTVAGYVAEYEAGRREGSSEEYFGKELGPKDLCRLHGIADR
ncbi:MAG TPA: hypothetical protein VKE40_17115 [Gemmataceae bacterium]|nr:hypothetical protein [Gemmataceae bacterium]